MANATLSSRPAATAFTGVELVYMVQSGTSVKATTAQFATYIGGSFQPLDADLTAIAALATTSFGRSLLTLADAAAGRTAFAISAPSLTATYIGYGSGANLLTGDATLTYTASGAALSVSKNHSETSQIQVVNGSAGANAGALAGVNADNSSVFIWKKSSTATASGLFGPDTGHIRNTGGRFLVSQTGVDPVSVTVGGLASTDEALTILAADGSGSKIGNVGIGYGGGASNPTARLHLAAGTATAGTAPLKLASGTNLTAPESGAIEYDGTNLTYTDSGLTRRTLAYGASAPALTSTYIGYGDGSNLLTGSSELTWSSSKQLQIRANRSTSVSLDTSNSDGSSTTTAMSYMQNRVSGGGSIAMQSFGSNYTTSGLYIQSGNQLIASGGPLAIISVGGDQIFGVAATTAGSEYMRTLSADGSGSKKGNVGLGYGGVANPTARLHVKAGTATAGTAPFKLTSGTNLTTPESGAIEFNGANLFFTNSTPERVTIGQGLYSAGSSTAFGVGALSATTSSGTHNTAFGYQAGAAITGGPDNVAVGYQALQVATTGDSNTAVGKNALLTLSTGYSNVAVGAAAGDTITTGFNNVIVGPSGGVAVTTGDNNVLVGNTARPNDPTDGNSIAIGKLAVGIGSDTAVIGGPFTTTLQLGTTQNFPIDFTLQGRSANVGSTSNSSGGTLTVASGRGTGNSTESSLILQSPVAVGSGSTGQTMTTGLTIKRGQAVSHGYTVATLPTGITGGRAHVTDATAPVFMATIIGGGSAVCPVFYDGANWVAG